MNLLDKSIKCQCGVFHNYPFISGSYENETAGNATETHTVCLQPPPFSFAQSFNNYTQTYVQVQQATPDGI